MWTVHKSSKKFYSAKARMITSYRRTMTVSCGFYADGGHNYQKDRKTHIMVVVTLLKYDWTSIHCTLEPFTFASSFSNNPFEFKSVCVANRTKMCYETTDSLMLTLSDILCICRTCNLYLAGSVNHYLWHYEHLAVTMIVNSVLVCK